MITASEFPQKRLPATMLKFTWDIFTQLLVVAEQLFGGTFAGSNYIGRKFIFKSYVVHYVLAYTLKASKTV